MMSERRAQAGMARPPPRSLIGDTLMGFLALVALAGAALAGWRHLDDPAHRVLFGAALLGVVTMTPILRRALLRFVLLASVTGAVMLAYEHRETLLDRDLEIRDAAPKAVEWIKKSAPFQAVADLYQRTLTQHLANSYARYTQKVVPRDPEINKLASEIVEDCDDADHVCESSLLLRFVTEAIAYRVDPRGRGDYIKAPHQTLEASAGDCEDQVILLVSLLESVGNTSFMAFTDSHTYPMVCFDESLDVLLLEKKRSMTPRAYRRYLGLIAPYHNVDLLLAAADRVVKIPLDGRHCYPLEPTARGSWLGYDHSEPIKTILDPISGQVVTSDHRS